MELREYLLVPFEEEELEWKSYSELQMFKANRNDLLEVIIA